MQQQQQQQQQQPEWEAKTAPPPARNSASHKTKATSSSSSSSTVQAHRKVVSLPVPPFPTATTSTAPDTATMTLVPAMPTKKDNETLTLSCQQLTQHNRTIMHGKLHLRHSSSSAPLMLVKRYCVLTGDHLFIFKSLNSGPPAKHVINCRKKIVKRLPPHKKRFPFELVERQPTNDQGITAIGSDVCVCVCVCVCTYCMQ